MSDQNDNVYYILLADKTGKEKERGILRPTSKVDVFPGTLLLLVEERNDKQRDILWWTLEALDPENIEIECQPTDTGQLSKTEFALLQPIPVCEERLSIFQDQVWLKEGAQLQINDHVTVAVEGQPYLKGILKYKGQLPREKGIWFGIELLGESKGYGTCEGVFRDRRLFTCEQKCGIFATIREVRRDHDADRSYQEEQRLIEESGLREKDRVVWISDNGPEFGEVKWIGILPDSNRRDITVGVEFDNPVGTGTGKYRNHRLFYAKEKHASLVPSMGLMKADVYMEMGQGTGTFSNANCLHDYRILLKPDHINLPIMSQTRSTLPTRTPNYNHVRKEMLPIPHSYEMECNTNSTSLDRNDGLAPLSTDLSKNLFQYINHIPTHHSNPKHGVTLQQFQVFAAHALKGTFEEKATIFCGMKNSRNITMKDVSEVTTGLLVVYKHHVTRLPHWRGIHTMNSGAEGNQWFVSYLTKGLTASGENERVTVSDVETWMSKTPHLMNLFDTVFSSLFQFHSMNEIMENIPAMVPIPLFEGHRDEAVLSVLDHNSVLYLNYNLPSMYQSEWRFLFSNSVYGDSFSQLVAHITSKGPNLLVVRDKKGHLFGGVAADNWECRPKFYGSSSCFLFTLNPHYGIYTPTMYNENFMYLNQGQATLLNGLGMGGQMDYFGLWIDSSFNHGHSKAKPKCTTYGSPQLSAEPEFEVDIIEVWGLGPEKKEEGDSDEEKEKNVKKSILQRDPESKAMLELMGRTQVSEGFQELEEDEDQSEEMKRKMNTIPKLL